jgi:polysaccharide deacetylase family protein (PEP-CTERM system associated)
MIVNVLTVDVEEYYHAAIFRRGTSSLPRRTFESRVEGSMERLLELLRNHHTRATFFVLGEVAAAHPGLMRTLVAEQHEVACHGDRHEDVCRQSPGEFRADIRRAKAQIEEVVTQPVIGYRAPNFSIGRAQSWAYAILAEEGFSYDSSLYPLHHDRYGQPDALRFPHEIWRKGSTSLTEFPIGTTRLMGTNLPVGGGGLFRLLPYALFRRGIRRVNQRERQPVMFYLHPWELDPDQPRPPMALRHRIRHYAGLQQEAGKLSRLLGQFRFGTVRDFLHTRVSRIRVFEPVVDQISIAV